ncbi:uncharacterized protein hdly isoform X2 [Drosophila kikkawai]|uniref:Uncharacterized protein hdly isoform X2 n=1 Tax=Drosophila kikkawai TaxID=30033 RepID=A0ABM4GK32_DROKI
MSGIPEHSVQSQPNAQSGVSEIQKSILQRNIVCVEQRPASQPKEMNRTAGRRLPALQFALLLSLVALATARPPTEDDSDGAILPPDADNVEIHQVEFVNGVMQEDHPVIMYKEDFVTEDFDPAKNATSPGHHKKHRRTHHRHAEPQPENEGEKILFDVLPDKPIVLKDDLEAAPVSNLEATQLVTPVKEQLLRKLPKKYHSRQRRSPQWNGIVSGYSYSSHLPLQTLYYIPRLAVSGKKPNLQGGNRGSQTNKIVNEEVPVPDDLPIRLDLEHDSNPANADFSQFNKPRPTRPSNSVVSGGGRDGPLSGGSNAFPRPENRPATNRPPQSQAPTTAPKVTNCVWAIVNCCDNGSKKIRYSCFESFGCHGAFWGINPCADEGVLDDTLQFPQELEHQAGSNCQRASKYCCSLRNIASLYDCYQKQGCNDSLSDIISGCS